MTARFRSATYFVRDAVVRQVSGIALVGFLSACSLYQYSQITPARSDSLDCARTTLQDLGYEIYRDNEEDGVIQATRVFGSGITGSETQEFLSVRAQMRDGRPTLRVATGTGQLTTDRRGDSEPAIGQTYRSPTRQAIADVERLLTSCGGETNPQ